MSGATSIWRSTIGKKYVMAVSGILLVAWILLHAVGNLKIFEGPEKFNQYSEFLRLIGAPALGESQALWAMRLGLLLLLVLHVASFVSLWRIDMAARRTHYRKYQPEVFSFSSRTMRWGGIAVFLFVVYHLLHFTTGHAHPDFIAHDPYSNLVSAFQNPLVVLVYLTAVVALGLHLYHGIWSAFQTLGVTTGKGLRIRRPLALVVSVAITLIFAVVPLAVLLGIVR
jgi:succinate dehydrogenase / fumarate reductase, cytochrome b subunit